ATSGKLIKQITKGKWVVNAIVGWNKSQKDVIILASKESPLEQHIYAVNYNSGSIKRLDKHPGVHQAMVSSTGEYVLDKFKNEQVANQIELINVRSGKITNILKSKNPLTEYAQPEVRNVTLKADDGTPLYGKLILPINFDSTKKYPVIVYLYGGPH